MLVERLGGCPPAEGLARPAVERGSNCFEILSGVSREVRTFREVLSEQPVGVLIGSSLPRALRVTEIHLQAAVDGELRVLCQMGSLDPR